ncbi:response regulator [Paenibacillus glucanolyticus]|uniref:response regulator n=1 Tax=Paenibacillus glucanolyticus TaxID=59843 RepID=UPI00096BF314|nr:response regulator [Paenibacillus glucanolyticus]OMF80045.1 DNA-binding response regulator [Paenibacillus glucanolyticus]
MYNVLIADDEIEVREGLKLKVDWEGMGFAISGEAANGVEAEALLRAERFDLLITDMNMPVMDGVRLLDTCRSHNPSIQIIIITGYEDFQYARAGVRSQAMDYLLKPVTREDLRTALTKIKAELDKNRKVRDDSEMMQWRLSQYYKEMKERFLLDLVRGNRLPASSLPERIRLFHLESWQDHRVCFIAAGMRESSIQHTPKGRAPEQLHLPFEMVCHEIAQSYPGSIQVFHDAAHPGIMFFITLDGVQHEFTRKLAEDAASYLTMDVQVGLGLPVSGLERWKEGYIHSLLAWNLAERQKEQDRTPVTDHSPLLPEETNRTLHRCLIRGELDSFRSVIRKELAEAYQLSPSRLVRSLFQISLLMESAAADFMGYSQGREPHWISPEWVLWMETPEQAERLLMQWAQDFVDQQQVSEDGEATLIESAKRYIEENYMQELTLTSLAEQYNYHPTYFSEMFKEGAGISFIHYVTEVRMKHAVRLLKETTLTVWDIAELAGFSSPGYFSSKFKKMFNISPSEFRLSQSEKIEHDDPKK